jgi:hypothetical protein
MNTPCAALIIAIAAFAQSARADDHCALVATLNTVMAEATQYQPIACPKIGFSALDAKAGMRSQAGAYFPETGQIELAPDLDLGTAYGQSFLLHEMIHAAQFAEGADRTAPCPAALEAEAYAIQAQFLQAAGLSREALLTRLLGGQLGTCGSLPDY